MLPKPIRSWLSPFAFPTKGYREAAEPARPNNLLIDALLRDGTCALERAADLLHR